MTSQADTGEADARLARALASGDRTEVLAALVGARVFAAITATATAEHTTASGLRAESSAELAVVLLELPDGSRALPVFHDLGSLRRWRADARPIPLTGPQACAAALDERAGTLLLDPAGAALAVTELAALAQGWVPVAGTALSARRAQTALWEAAVPAPRSFRRAVRRALAGERLRSARLLEGSEGPVLGVAADRELAPGELAALAQRLVDRLGDALPEQGLSLVQVRARGVGREVLPRFRRGR